MPFLSPYCNKRVILFLLLVLSVTSFKTSLSLCQGSTHRRFMLKLSMLSSNTPSFEADGEDNLTATSASGDATGLVDDAVNAPVGPMPTVSSKINFGKEKLDIKYDLWIVGAGTLGMEIAKEWKRLKPSSKIVAETKSTNRHENLIELGVIPKIRDDRAESDDKSARTVIIAIPPSAKSEKKTKSGYSYNGYIEELSEATRLWAGPSGGGSLLFTSSIGIYGDSIGNTVTENFRVDSRSQKATSLISAEEVVLTRGGAVVRLAGLYLAKRGPHSYWLTIDTVDGAADGIVNMVHYEDASTAVVKAALYNAGKVSPIGVEEGIGDKLFQSIFLVCDDWPVNRRDICLAALDSGLFPKAKVPNFSSESGPKTKICDSSLTRRLLNWKPKYKSFSYYMRTVIGGLSDLDEGKLSPKNTTSSLWIPGVNDDDIIDLKL